MENCGNSLAGQGRVIEAICPKCRQKSGPAKVAKETIWRTSSRFGVIPPVSCLAVSGIELAVFPGPYRLIQRVGKLYVEVIRLNPKMRTKHKSKEEHARFSQIKYFSQIHCIRKHNIKSSWARGFSSTFAATGMSYLITSFFKE